MTPDYLDLLLDRATGAVPFAEPRIAPATLGASTAPAWEEIAEETVHSHPAPPTEPEPGTTSVQEPSHKQTVSPPASRPVIEKSRNLEEPSALHVSRQGASVPENRLADSPRPFTPGEVAPTPRELRPAPPQIAGGREERKASAVDEPPANPSIPPAANRTELRSSRTLSEQTLERTIQTQRLFPAASVPNFAHNSDWRITSPSKPTQPSEPAPISIRIDRIEVRAGGSSLSPIAPPQPRPAAPLGLEEYLKRKSGGDR